MAVLKTGSTANFVAIDLGADSSRGVLGRFDGDRLTLQELHRAPNEPVRLPNGLHWDALRLLSETHASLAIASHETRNSLESVGVDSWAVDYGLLDRDGALIANPFHYRDVRTEGMVEAAYKVMPRPELYGVTGIQSMPINTLCQLLAHQASSTLQIAETLLLIPDLIRYWLTGSIAAEYTVATTTQLLDQDTGDWAREIIERFRLPGRVFPPIVRAGMSHERLLPAVAEDLGLGPGTTVTTTASHDTAAAVAALPIEVEDFGYISCGTWSLVGVELPQPILSEPAMLANCTNEGGVDGTIRFLKNVMGLWLLQESRRTWSRLGQNYNYGDLNARAAAAPPFGPILDPDYPGFLTPGDMPARIAERCRATGQEPPEDVGTIVRCILESLALKYRSVVEEIAALTGRQVQVLHVVGGGAQNALLCQLTADATRRPVLAGPVEATALGNVLVQAMGHHHLDSLREIRSVVRRSVNVTRYNPSASSDRWDDAYSRLLEMTAAARPDGD